MSGMENVRKYLDRARPDFDKEKAEAFVAGYCQALTICGYSTPDLRGDRVQHIIHEIIKEEERHYRSQLETAELLLRHYHANKAAFRAMMFDCAFINDEGQEVDYAGEPVDPEQHESYLYEDVTFVPETESEEIVPYIVLTNRAGDEYKVYKNNRPFIEAILRQDIQIGDPINRRYMKESLPGGMLGEYLDVIQQALPMLNHEINEIPAAGFCGDEAVPDEDVTEPLDFQPPRRLNSSN